MDTSGLDVEPKYAFDLRPDVATGVEFVRNDALVYPVGRHFAIHDYLKDANDGGEYLQQNMHFILREGNHTSTRPPMYVTQDVGAGTIGSSGVAVKDDKNKIKQTGSNNDDEDDEKRIKLPPPTTTKARHRTEQAVALDPDLQVTAHCIHPKRKHYAVAEYSHLYHAVLISVIDITTAAKSGVGSGAGGKNVSARGKKVKSLMLPAFNPLGDMYVRMSSSERQQQETKKGKKSKKDRGDGDGDGEDDGSDDGEDSDGDGDDDNDNDESTTKKSGAKGGGSGKETGPTGENFFDSAERRTLKTDAPAFCRIVHLTFSEDGRYMALQGDYPKWPLLIWDWQLMSKPQKKMKFALSPVSSIAFHPFNNMQVMVAGPDVLRMYPVDPDVHEKDSTFVDIRDVIYSSKEFKNRNSFEGDGDPEAEAEAAAAEEAEAAAAAAAAKKKRKAGGADAPASETAMTEKKKDLTGLFGGIAANVLEELETAKHAHLLAELNKQPDPEEDKFTSVAYLRTHKDAIVVTTHQHIVVLMRNKVVQCVNVLDLATKIRCVVATNKGFVVGCHGYLCTYHFSSYRGENGTALAINANGTATSTEDVNAYRHLIPYSSAAASADISGASSSSVSVSAETTQRIRRASMVAQDALRDTENVTAVDRAVRVQSMQLIAPFTAPSLQVQLMAFNDTDTDYGFAAETFEESDDDDDSDEDGDAGGGGNILGHFKTAKKMDVRHLAVSPSLTTIAIVSNLRDVIVVDLADLDLLPSDDTPDFHREAQECLTPVITGLSGGAIDGMDVALNQPLLATICRADHSVRLYNYHTQSCELVSMLPQHTLHSIALHPDGTALALGCDRYIRLYTIFLDELVVSGEILFRNAVLLRYSNGGQYIACVSFKELYIYATRTLKFVARFKGHQDAITDICWSGTDSTITSCGLDGGVYTWNVPERRRVRDYLSKNVAYGGVVMDAHNRVVVTGVELFATTTARSPTAPVLHQGDGLLQFNQRIAPATTDAGAMEFCHYPDLSKEEQMERHTSDALSLLNLPASLSCFPPTTYEARSAAVAAAGKFVDSGVGSARGSVAGSGSEGNPNTADSPRDGESAVAGALGGRLKRTDMMAEQAQDVMHGHHSVIERVIDRAQVDHHRSFELISCSSGNLRTYKPPELSPTLQRLMGYWRMALITIGRSEFLVIGTHRGTVQLYDWPLHASGVRLTENSIHTSAITQLRVCRRTACIITAAVDGSVFVSSVSLLLASSTAVSTTAASAPTAVGGGALVGVFSLLSFLQQPFYPPLYAPVARRLVAETRRRMRSGEVDERFSMREGKLYGCSRLMQYSGVCVGATQESDDSTELTTVTKATRRRGHANALGNHGTSHDATTIMYVSDVRRMLRHMQQLQIKLKSFRQQWRYKIKRDQDGIRKLLTHQKTQYNTKLHASYLKQRQLQKLDVDREREVRAAFEHMSKDHVKSAEDLEKLYERKLAMEARRYNALLDKKRDAETSLQLENVVLTRRHATECAKLTAAYETDMALKQKKLDHMKKMMTAARKEYVDMFEKQDVGIDAQLYDMKQESQRRENESKTQIKALEHSNTILRGQLAHHMTKLRSLKEQAVEANEASRDWNDQVTALKAKLQESEAKVAKLENDVVDGKSKHSTLHAANLDLMDQNMVLSHQIKDLMRMAENNDKGKAMAYFDTTIKELDSEFDEARVTILAHERTIKQQKELIGQLNHMVQHSQTTLHDRSQEIEKIKEDISNVAHIKLLRAKYPSNAADGAGYKTQRQAAHLQNRRIEREYSRQTTSYTKNLSFMKHTLKQVEFQCNIDKNRSVEQNGVLMHQNAELRRAVHEQKTYVAYMKAELIAERTNYKNALARMSGDTLQSSQKAIRSFLLENAQNKEQDEGRGAVVDQLHQMLDQVDPNAKKRGISRLHTGGAADLWQRGKAGQNNNDGDDGEDDDAGDGDTDEQLRDHRIMSYYSERKLNRMSASATRKAQRQKAPGRIRHGTTVSSSTLNQKAKRGTGRAMPSESNPWERRRHGDGGSGSGGSGSGRLTREEQARYQEQAENLLLQTYQRMHLQNLEIAHLRAELAKKSGGFFEFDTSQSAPETTQPGGALPPPLPLAPRTRAAAATTDTAIGAREAAGELISGRPSSPTAPTTNLSSWSGQSSMSASQFQSLEFQPYALHSSSSSGDGKPPPQPQPPGERPSSSGGGRSGKKGGVATKRTERAPRPSTSHGPRY